MGWWWSSSSSSDQTSTASSSLPHSQSASSSLLQDPATTTIPPPSKPTTAPTSTSTHDDAELREFLAAIEWTSDSSNPSSAKTSSSSSSTSDPNSDPSSISFESLYPTSLSCRSAFDYAFFCQSFGGQWVNVYRYGNLRSCSEHWENFWLCMRSRGYSDESRRETIRDHYRKKAVKYKTGPSSEDVWEVRTEPLQNPFGADMAAYKEQQKPEKIEGEPLGQP